MRSIVQITTILLFNAKTYILSRECFIAKESILKYCTNRYTLWVLFRSELPIYAVNRFFVLSPYFSCRNCPQRCPTMPLFPFMVFRYSLCVYPALKFILVQISAIPSLPFGSFQEKAYGGFALEKTH